MTTKNPTWYQTIINKQKEGIPCILFIDELSVCPSLVQGALYRLIFERTIGNGNTLPDDCVIISAGNFKENLPSYCDITSPSLNRFCVINLCPDNYMDFLDEFSQDEEERIADWPEFNDPFPTMTDAFKKNARAEVKNMMMEILFINRKQTFPLFWIVMILIVMILNQDVNLIMEIIFVNRI